MAIIFQFEVNSLPLESCTYEGNNYFCTCYDVKAFWSIP